MIAKKHPRQADRLEALQRLGVLNDGHAMDFERIVRFLSEMCETPVSMVNLVDEDRQITKAAYGYQVGEMTLAESICSHAILENSDVIEIGDLGGDPRTASNPLLTEQGVRFYAGAPLRTDSGLPIGALCVLDRNPRVLTPMQREALSLMAGLVMRQIELGEALERARVLRHEMDHRVKNSLQTVLSVVRLYRSRAGTEEAKDAFDAVCRRIDAVANLHGELYRTSAHNRVSLDAYVARILDLARDGLPANVGIVVDVDTVQVTSEQATALGIIISEFANNAGKHAFPDGRAGTVTITGKLGRDGQVAISCRDDGIGSANPDPDAIGAVESLGVQLMKAAAGQLGSKLSVKATEAGFHLDLKIAMLPANDAPHFDEPAGSIVGKAAEDGAPFGPEKRIDAAE